ncbi:MAG: hypothetical protein SCL54_05280 [Bacillota bacterium]|nr:hypothetical protein [Bacillota bacterium]
MKKVLSLVLVAVMIMTLSSSAIFAAPNNNPNAAFNREKSAFENKVKNKTMNEGELEALREQLRFVMLSGEGVPYGLAKRTDLPPGFLKIFGRTGLLPHGIGKRLMEDYPMPGQKTDLEVLRALIETANSKATVALSKDYEGGLTTIKDFKDAIQEAKDFVGYYDETHKAQIKNEIDDLKDAMKKFDDLKYLELNDTELIAIETRLKVYQVKYEDYLSPTKKVELQNLINFINTFTRTDNRVKLTKGEYDSILMQEKAFKDPLVSLYMKLDEAKIMLYVDIEAPNKTYKVVIGTEPGEYLSAGVVGLHNTIVLAESFVDNYTNESLNDINDEIKALDDAIDAFKDSEVLGTTQKSTLKMISDQLKDYYDVEETVALDDLIDDIAPFLAVESTLTVGIYNDFMDRSEEYIDDLYAYMIEEIKALIKASEKLLDDNAPRDLAEEEALYAKVVEVETYLLTAVKYDNLVTYYSQLNVLYQALQAKL